MIAKRRRFGFIGVHWGVLDILDRIALNHVSLTEVLKKAGKGGEFSADRGPTQLTLFQVLAPGDQMRPG
jgi:hypothetical protein